MRRAVPIVVLALSACVPQTRSPQHVGRTPSPNADARTGGTLRVAITPPDGIDPTGAHEPAGELVTRTMCDQLITLDPVTGEPQPSIASSWTVSSGGQSLFVRLRPEARFSDGTPVTAEDVRFTLSRLANELFASPSASLLESVGGYGFVHGELDTSDEHLRQELSGVTLVDAHTISIGLFEARGDLFRALAHPATSPIPRAAVEADPAAFARAPVCSGPYALRSEPAPGGPIVLERVAGYEGANASLSRGGAGYADTISFRVHETREAAVAAFRAGDADVAPIPETDRRPAPTGGSIQLLPGLQTEFIGMPTTQPPLDDARVRIALSRALDRGAIARNVFGDRRQPATAFLPAVLDPGEAPSACTQNGRGSLEAARELLSDAGVAPEDIEAEFVYNDEFSNGRLVTEIARQWRALGVEITPVPMPWEQYVTLATRPQGLDGVFRFGWAPLYPSAERIIAPLFTVNGIGRDNWSLYSSRDLSDALRELREAEEERDRAREVRRAHEILCDELPMLPLLQDLRAFLIRDQRVGSAVGTYGDATTAQPLLRELYLR
jgi:oligopeptide transport system substrate-binding protein